MKLFLKLLTIILMMISFVSTAQATIAPLLADTYIDATSPTLNYGASALVRINSNANAFLKFTLQALPAVTASEINKATLFIYVKRIAPGSKLQVKQITKAWALNGLTYNNIAAFIPTFISAPVAVAANPVVGGYFAIDVTWLVKSWVTTPTSNYGLMLQPDALTPATAIAFDSKEATGASYPAYIDIVLNGAKGDTGLKGDKGDKGLTGAKGDTGATTVNTVAVCNNSGLCGCNTKTISLISTKTSCQVTATTGSCTAIKPVYSPNGDASCCVCSSQ